MHARRSPVGLMTRCLNGLDSKASRKKHVLRDLSEFLGTVIAPMDMSCGKTAERELNDELDSGLNQIREPKLVLCMEEGDG